ncbi:hypothetical protein [Paraburkholderia sp. J10-1]|uniref:hypothetical protein n=1 Tax=Paraburkholderia sp. J10-1 TaxID=2805430 RepID=UPI002AB79E4E|nr:hypothetical protein [Paraburkholderia sp. J10-1]
MVKAMGDKAVSSDAMFVIDNHEDLRLLCKQFPWPILSPAGEIEVPMPLGAAAWQPQQLKINQQGQVTFLETVEGHVAAFVQAVVADGAKFNATVYEGTMEEYKRKVRILDAFFVFDNPDRDWENRGQVLNISGTLFFHYFGEQSKGNI